MKEKKEINEALKEIEEQDKKLRDLSKKIKFHEDIKKKISRLAAEVSGEELKKGVEELLAIWRNNRNDNL